MSEGELLDHGTVVDPNHTSSVVSNNIVMSSGHLADAPFQNYFIWNNQGRPSQSQGKLIVNDTFRESNIESIWRDGKSI